METLSMLLANLQPENILACLIGALVGTLVGVLPGVGPTGTMALLLPLTFNLGPTAGMIMLAGIWYGAQYGGSTTSILVNVPGESASVVTTLDGYQMARKGRAGAALAAAAIGSFIAGTISILALQLFAPPLADVAVAFGSAEYFGIALLGLIILSNLTGKSYLKSLIMALLGVMLSTVGLDPVAGVERFTFNSVDLLSGFGFVPVVMGLFGVAEILSSIGEPERNKQVFNVRFRELYPTKEELRRALPPMFRGGVLGFLVGLVPGPAATLAAFLSYAGERRFSKRREEFGKGAIEGVAGPEAANNAACAGGLVPLLALGLPFAPPTAVLLSGLMIHGVTPGPLLIQNHPEIFWGVIASMYLGNIFLVVLNLPLVGVFASITKVSAKYLMPGILLLCVIGAYGENNSIFDVWVMLVFGVVGYILRKYDFEPAPLILGLVLGNILESNLRQALLITGGSIWGLWQRPITAVILSIAIIAIVAPVIIKYAFKKDVTGFVQQE